MNPQLYQGIKLMELPLLDLRERIEQELENNPALEITEDRSTVSLDAQTGNDVKEDDNYFENTSDPGQRGSRTSDEHSQFIEGVLTKPETLHEHLLWQLQLEPVDDEVKSIAEILIQNLNDDGFHIEKPETLFKKIPCKLYQAIDLVRGLEPVGCCTCDYKESLKVQINLIRDFKNIQYLPEEKYIDIILDNLDLIERGKYSAFSKKTGINEDEIRFLYKFIKELSPFPGRAFAPGNVRYVIPEIKVVRDTEGDNQEELVIKLNDEAFPVLGINPFLKKLENGGKNDREDYAAAREFARKNIKEANLFISHLKKRNKILIRVARAVLEFQRSFFVKGPKYLAPLTLNEIAKELNVHETTVSRTANGKYMQTEWGIYEIRYFFTN